MSSYLIRKTPGDTEWFRHDRFGMFIHFGLYALPARHEWVKSYEKIPEDKYNTYFENFDPDLCDPRAWARAAKAAGIKYAVLTTKHHEGFCLFDTKYTDYNVMNTPYGRDLVREYVDAFRAEGLKIGFYYSLIDWHHPDFPIDIYHPRRDDDNAEALDAGRDMHKYAQYMRNQVAELLTDYGKIDIMWFDFSYGDEEQNKTNPGYHPWMRYSGGKTAAQWEAEELLKLARKLQPGIIIDNRTDLEADLWTPEQFQPSKWVTDRDGNLVTWEACQTFSGSWGYFRDEQTWKSPEMLINLLINTVSIGGNLIMNVGPTGRGYLDYRAEAALKEYTEWMKYNSRAIYGCTMAEPEFKVPQGTRLTQSEDGKRLYIHLQEYPFAFLEMHGLADKIRYAQFLNDASEVPFTIGGSGHFSNFGADSGDDLVVFHLPAVKPHTVVPVIEVLLK